jgi:hypothetical protein
MSPGIFPWLMEAVASRPKLIYKTAGNTEIINVS